MKRLTDVLDSLSMLRRRKSCLLLQITIFPHLLLLSIATCLFRHASLRIWGAHWVMIADWTVKLSIVLRRFLFLWQTLASSVSQSWFCHPHQGGCLQGCLCLSVAVLLLSMDPFLRLSMFIVFRPSLVFAGGKKYHTLRCSRRLRLPRSNICWLKGNSIG